VRVRIYAAGADEPAITWPSPEPVRPLPGMVQRPLKWLGWVAGKSGGAGR